MSRPIGVTIVAIVVWIAGILEVLRGIIRLFTGSSVAARADGDVAVLTLAAIGTIIVGAAVITLAFGVFNGSNPSRFALTIVLALIVLDAVLSSIFSPGELVLAIITAVLAIGAAAVLYLPQANSYFTQPVRR